MKTKKIWCLIAVALFMRQGFAQLVAPTRQFILKGKINGTTMDSVVLYYQYPEGEYKQESKPIVNSEFTLTGIVPYMSDARLLFKNAGEKIKPEQYATRMKEIYLEPTTLVMTGDPAKIDEIKITGSKTQDDLQELANELAPVRQEMKPVLDAYHQEKDPDKAYAIREKLWPLDDRMDRITYHFFITHPNSYATANIVQNSIYEFGLDTLKQIYHNFNKEIQDSDQGKNLAKEIEKMEVGLPGKMAAEFTVNDINDRRLSIADFRGKYVIIDFWASWCVPCRKGIPHLMELYDKYKSKGFDVIGVSDDYKTEAWKSAIEKDGTGVWHHVLRGYDQKLALKHLANPRDISEKYGISSLPTKILIDPSGKIIGRYGDNLGGTDEDLDKMLASIFDK